MKLGGAFSAIELTYTGRERSFVTWSAILGYAFDFGAVRNVTLIWSAFSAAGLLLAGLASDRIGRKLAVVASTCICILGFAAIYCYGRVDYPGAVLSWPLFWGYALWGLGQGSIGVFGPWYSELFPVELRSTGTSVTFTTGRLIGSAMPYLVPVIAALLGDLFNAMMFGVIGAVQSLLFALFLPETAGRKFTVIEGKEHG
jgi:MFS family permease